MMIAAIAIRAAIRPYSFAVRRRRDSKLRIISSSAKVRSREIGPQTIVKPLSRGTCGLDPTLPHNPCRRRLVRKQGAMIGSAQHVIDRDAVIGQREQSSAIEDWHAAKCCLALDDQTPAG